MPFSKTARAAVGRRPQYHRLSLPMFVALLCVGLSGCGSALIPVHGTVQQEGKPVAGGTVVFSPVAEGKRAIGPIQPDGTFQLTTNTLNDGAMAGQYQLTFTRERDPETERTGGTFTSPPDRLFEVAAGKQNEFLINVRKSDGWQAVVGD